VTGLALNDRDCTPGQSAAVLALLSEALFKPSNFVMRRRRGENGASRSTANGPD
jgi:hypothetical protein